MWPGGNWRRQGGYTEALTDSDGTRYGKKFGAVLIAFGDAHLKTGKARHRLQAPEKKHRAAVRIARAERIMTHSLGRAKLEARRDRTQKKRCNIAYQAAHVVADKAAVVGSEDLTSPIKGRVRWKWFNRRMSGWARRVPAQAADEVCTQRGATHVVVSAAYTSQMDPFTGLLEGNRVGDRFCRVGGDVLQADFNTARNVWNRIHDQEIPRYMPDLQVKQILLAHSSGATGR